MSVCYSSYLLSEAHKEVLGRGNERMGSSYSAIVEKKTGGAAASAICNLYFPPKTVSKITVRSEKDLKIPMKSERLQIQQNRCIQY